MLTTIKTLSSLSAALLITLTATGCTTSGNSAPGPSSERKDANRPGDVPTTAKATGASSGNTVNRATNNTN